MKYVDDDLPFEQIRDRFRADIYASETTGIEILEARKDYGRAVLELDGRHVNGQGGVMGGAIFTLADYAFAIATNTGQEKTVTVETSIHFMAPPRGKKLFAEAKMLRSGRHLCCCEVTITDEFGTQVATTTATGARVG